MFTIPMHALPYPAVLHRTDGPQSTVSRVREMRLATPLDRLAQWIAREFDVALVEVVDERRGQSVITGRCAAGDLPAAAYALPWSVSAAIPGADGPVGRLVLRERGGRAWQEADRNRLESAARLVGRLLADAPAPPNGPTALAS